MNRIGEKFVSKESLGACEYIVVEYNSYSDIWIEFQDSYRAKVHTTYGACRKGSVKNPYFPSICGIGMLGLMSDGSRPTIKENGELTKHYVVWKSMIQRCYDSKTQERQPTYKNVNVCDRWLIYSNFLEDIKSIEGYELWKANPSLYSLDKDLKQQGVKNKVYSLETCCFISNIENARESDERNPNPPIKVYGINIKTDEYTKVFNSLREAERETGISQSSIGKCLNGIYKQSGGYTWHKI